MLIIFEKFKTLLWFLKRPNHWRFFFFLIIRKLDHNYDSKKIRSESIKWAKNNTVSKSDAFKKLGISINNSDEHKLDKEIIAKAKIKENSSPVNMGGAGDLELIYSLIKSTNSKKIIETGVAYGWSTLAILEAIKNQNESQLISVDMHYPKMNNDNYVGIVVPENLKDKWELLKLPDRNGLEIAIKKFGGVIDICHYDSDKSFQGRIYGYNLLWNALKIGGIFISDDIQDNFAFKIFAKQKSVPFSITEYKGKYIGIIKKVIK